MATERFSSREDLLITAMLAVGLTAALPARAARVATDLGTESLPEPFATVLETLAVAEPRLDDTFFLLAGCAALLFARRGAILIATALAFALLLSERLWHFGAGLPRVLPFFAFAVPLLRYLPAQYKAAERRRRTAEMLSLVLFVPAATFALSPPPYLAPLYLTAVVSALVAKDLLSRRGHWIFIPMAMGLCFALAAISPAGPQKLLAAWLRGAPVPEAWQLPLAFAALLIGVATIALCARAPRLSLLPLLAFSLATQSPRTNAMAMLLAIHLVMRFSSAIKVRAAPKKRH